MEQTELNFKTTTIEEYIELAKVVEIGDPFDWSNVPIDEDSAYRLVAMSVMCLNLDKEVAIASIIKLCVENMVLNMRLLEKE
jgi:hypothetical protein